jgi:hypothetical protein
MAGFSFNPGYLTTPIKLVLPGIVVSVIGLFANNYFFNNAEKTRGRNSRAAWDNLSQYEKIYSDFSEQIICQYDGQFNDEYVDDLIHIQEMTSENLKTLKDDKDIDKQMATILNLRIDTYAKLKSTSKAYFDSIFIVYNNLSIDNKNDWQAIAARLNEKYTKAINRIYYRDTSIITILGAELSKKYSSFKKVNFSFTPGNSLKNLNEDIIGRWSLLSIHEVLRFEKDGKGMWASDTINQAFHWKLDSTILTINYDNNSTPVTLTFIQCTKQTIYFLLSDPAMFLTGCRIKEL